MSISSVTMHDWVMVLAHNNSKAFDCNYTRGAIATSDDVNDICGKMQLHLGKSKLCSKIRYFNYETIYFFLGRHDSDYINEYSTLKNNT